MGGQFQSAQAGYEAAAGFDAAGAEGFAAQMRQLMGEDFEPDSRFLEESWTMGVAAAAESWRARRQGQGQAERERQSQAFREMDSVGALAFIQASEWYAEIRRSPASSGIAGRFDAAWLQRCAEEPFGWSQARETVADVAGESSESSEEPVAGMTVGRACRLLGLTAARLSMIRTAP